ncbi:MAG TPA: hypothetical protein VMU32_08825 [Solirubrobacteraceae bacterium]|nr:hypothetical protein [Solirubrobacteraceae bacterium]
MNAGGGAARSLRAAVVAIALAATGVLCPSAWGATEAGLRASLSPSRPRGTRTLALTVHLKNTSGEPPEPLRRAILRLPAGLGLEIPRLRSCRAIVLATRGVKGCPSRSSIGGGSALVEGVLGTHDVVAPVTLHAFLGPLRNLTPTFEILSEGTYPISTQLLFTASSEPAPEPFGEELVMSLPPISSAPGEPDVSVLSLTLTIGDHNGTGGAATIALPAHCPSGGLPFAGEFAFADGSSATADTTSPCPHSSASRLHHARRASGEGTGRHQARVARTVLAQAAATALARTAKTVTLNEQGRLHLTSKRGFTLNEEGPASGTVSGTLAVELKIVSTSHVTAQLSLSTHSGSITGTASASYHRDSTDATFSGTLSISHGTGSYSDAHGSNLSFSGTIQRKSDAIETHVGGRVSE